MRQNAVKRKLAAGENVLGLILGSDCPDLVEIFAYAGLDWVMFDGEHGSIDPHHVENLVRAAEATGITPLARATQNARQTILRFLDVGVQGVMIPWCQGADEAREAVRAVKYYPEGNRGLAGARAAGFGVPMPLPEYVPLANAETMVIAQIETIQTLDALPEMLQVPGIDVFFIGPTDLSQSMGYPGRTHEPAVQEAIERIIAQILAAGRHAGIQARDAQDLKRYRDRGVQFLSAAAYGVIGRAVREFVHSAREP
jgi:4-hydroxy-2-oxoheptanedioate aldolase